MPSPNTIKYNSGSTATNTIKKGNFVLGVGGVDYAPTSSTNFWNGITPPTSGYTVYAYKVANGPSIRTANDDTQLVSIANGYGYTGSTSEGALSWFATNSDYIVVNISDYPNVVTSGLTTLLDGGSTVSYPRGNTTIYDAVNNVNNGTLINGTAFSATGGTGGSLYFDGVDDYVDIGAVPYLTSFSIDVWFYALTNIGPSYSPIVASFNNYLAAYPSGSGFFVSFPTAAFSTGGFSLNIWNNVVYTYDTTTQNGIFYINGVYDSTTSSLVGQAYSGSKYLGVRYAGDGQILKGNIGVVKVYDRAITAAEVTQNYNAYQSRYI